MPRYGHIQETIIQNFRAKPGQAADVPEPDLEDLLWTIAEARLVLGPEINIQAPPNLSRRATAPDRGRAQRLGRRLAGDARPCQSGSALAAVEELASEPRRSARCWSTGWRSIPPMRGGPMSGSRPSGAKRVRRERCRGLAREDGWSPGRHSERRRARRRSRARPKRRMVRAVDGPPGRTAGPPRSSCGCSRARDADSRDIKRGGRRAAPRGDR